MKNKTLCLPLFLRCQYVYVRELGNPLWPLKLQKILNVNCAKHIGIHTKNVGRHKPTTHESTRPVSYTHLTLPTTPYV